MPPLLKTVGFMSITSINSGSEEINVSSVTECDNCGEIAFSGIEEDHTRCPSCHHWVDPNADRKEATIPTRYIGQKENLQEIAALYDERAMNARRLYEEGWTTNIYVDTPNTITAIPEEQAETSEEHEPITDEQWGADSDGSTDAAEGIGRIEYICGCPNCGVELKSDHDEWNASHEFADEDELFCNTCGTAVEKNLIGIEFSMYPKFYFESPDSLRTVAFKLRGLACRLRSLKECDWYLSEIRDQYVYVRHGVDSTDDIVVDSKGHLQSMDT